MSHLHGRLVYRICTEETAPENGKKESVAVWQCRLAIELSRNRTAQSLSPPDTRLSPQTSDCSDTRTKKLVRNEDLPAEGACSVLAINQAKEEDEEDKTVQDDSNHDLSDGDLDIECLTVDDELIQLDGSSSSASSTATSNTEENDIDEETMSGENDVEYSNNMDLEEGELDDSAGASGGLSNRSRSSRRGMGSLSSAASSSLLDIDPVILIQLLDLKDRSSMENLWGLQPRPPASLLHSAAQCRKDREQRRQQTVRRSPPNSGVLKRLKAQMAEVRSKMSEVKSQMSEARSSTVSCADLGVNCTTHAGDQGPSGTCGIDNIRRNESGLDLLSNYITFASTKKCGSPKHSRPGSGTIFSLRRALECGDKDLHCQENYQPSTTGLSKPSSRQGSPHCVNKANDSEAPSTCKAEDRAFIVTASDQFCNTALNGLAALEMTRKVATLGSVPQCCLTDNQRSDSDNASTAGTHASPLEGMSGRPEEVALLQKKALQLLPGMSSDSESECETEIEEQEGNMSTELATHNFTTQSSGEAGDLGNSGNTNFVNGDAKE
ncbi:E3 ubiquitin-protein ligase TRIM37 isoform X2 [Rhincodon typus]|uniref:E3 ubiquitin-protein ligase TRIM37 isoform X2 n=1 Tax=Rhincodon typus TaxID=259920 RepID=UPI00203017B7|nr:E3 ubiquitin-protein ligase TRIM37 isoform X2 [Rhincodon typus]